MGIVLESLQLLDFGMDKVGLQYQGLKMLELGNQWMFMPQNSTIPYKSSAKEYFKKRGVMHTSLDINGEDGAISCDLGKPLDKNLLSNQYDVVTNFGTAEHVYDLYYCFYNIHQLCRVGGIMVHVFPYTGNWPKHGLHYATGTTFKDIATICNYGLLKTDYQFDFGNKDTGKCAQAVVQKCPNSEFPSKVMFDNLVSIERM
jgi:hypothetical protein